MRLGDLAAVTGAISGSDIASQLPAD
jgi:hypothetical protein